MTNFERYLQVFVETFSINEDQAQELEYQGISEWDSVGHMGLIAALEDAFDIMFDMDDIINLGSFKIGMEVLVKYDVEFG